MPSSTRRRFPPPSAGENYLQQPPSAKSGLQQPPSAKRGTSESTYRRVGWLGVVLLITCAVTEQIAPTAYGRFGADAKFAVSPRVGWWLMELPCTVVFLYFFFVRGGRQSSAPVPRFCAFVFVCHYAYRGWLFPALMRVHGNSKNFSLLPAIGGWSVTIVHGFLSAQWFAEHGAHLQRGWAQSVRFKLGVVLYYSGLAMLVWHDKLQRDLRAEPGPRYRVPTGGLFEYATAASYFAELWTWAGFAIMSWGPNGAFIFLVSLVNLVPRAAATHAWYLEQFPDYPPERKYLVPFVW